MLRPLIGSIPLGPAAFCFCDRTCGSVGWAAATITSSEPARGKRFKEGVKPVIASHLSITASEPQQTAVACSRMARRSWVSASMLRRNSIAARGRGGAVVVRIGKQVQFQRKCYRGHTCAWFTPSAVQHSLGSGWRCLGRLRLCTMATENEYIGRLML